MADSVDGSITDAVASTNLKVLGEAPAHSVAMVYQVLSESISLSIEGAQLSQSGLQQIGQAVVSVAVAKIMQNI